MAYPNIQNITDTSLHPSFTYKKLYNLEENIKNIKSILKMKTSSSSFTGEDKVFLMTQIIVFLKV